MTNLQGGLTALEERARSELGMVGNSETFYQVVTAATPAPAAPATPSPLARNEACPAARRVWAIVPAAGRGARFSASAPSAAPKQYARCSARTVLEWSLRRCWRSRGCTPWWWVSRRTMLTGPSSRRDSTRPSCRPPSAASIGRTRWRTALEFLAARAAADDWILVHDAARPCLSGGDLARLARRPRSRTRTGAAGGAARNGAVLAAPIVDTVKRELGDHVDDRGSRRVVARADAAGVCLRSSCAMR